MFGRVLRLRDPRYNPALVMLIGKANHHMGIGIIINDGEDASVSPTRHSIGGVGFIITDVNLASPFWNRWDDDEQSWYGGAMP